MKSAQQIASSSHSRSRSNDSRISGLALGHVDLEQQQVVAVDDHRLDPREAEPLLHRRLKVEQVERGFLEADVHLLAVLADHAEELDLLLQHVLDPLEDEAEDAIARPAEANFRAVNVDRFPNRSSLA